MSDIITDIQHRMQSFMSKIGMAPNVLLLSPVCYLEFSTAIARMYAPLEPLEYHGMRVYTVNTEKHWDRIIRVGYGGEVE